MTYRKGNFTKRGQKLIADLFFPLILGNFVKINKAVSILRVILITAATLTFDTRLITIEKTENKREAVLEREVWNVNAAAVIDITAEFPK